MSHVPQSLDDGLWRWTARHPDWHPGEFGAEVACFAVDTGSETVLVDPLLPGDGRDAETLVGLDDLVRDRVAIFVTIPYHVRSAQPLSARYGATVLGHPAVAKRLKAGTPFTAADPADDGLPGGARVFAIGRPRRHELPVWLPSHAALAFGDAVVESGGELRVWAHDPIDEKVRRFYAERFNPTLRPLVELGAERVLVTHGAPVLSGAAAALARAVEGEPWWHRG